MSTRSYEARNLHKSHKKARMIHDPEQKSKMKQGQLGNDEITENS